MDPITVPGMFQTGDHASRPAATDVGTGTLYACSTHSLIYQSDGATWSTWATLGGTPSGSITASGYTQTTARMLGRTTGSAGAIEEITVGSGLSLAAGALTATGGGSPTAIACRGTRASNQTIGTGAWTAVLFNVADTFDTSAMHDPAGANPERFVPPTTGYYQVNFRVQFNAEATGDRYCTLYKAGALAAQTDRQQANSTIGNVLRMDDILFLTATTDYVEGRVFQDAGTDRTVGAASLSIALIGI